MDVTQIIKKQEFFENIRKKKESGTLKNSLLFFCEDDLTSRTTLVLTALLLEFPTFELMDEKSAEFVRVESGVDLDVKLYPKNGEKLLVADSNDIVAEAYVKPVNLPYKIFIINNFDVSTEEAQNKLLKVLEEPPKNVFFILSAKSEEKVLPTIKSRCDKIKIKPLSKEEIQKICRDDLSIILGEGYIGKTLEFEKKSDLKNIVNFAISLICEMKGSRDVIKYSKKFLDQKQNLEIILQVISFAIEDMIKLKCDSEALCRLTPYLDAFKDVEAEYSVEALCEIFKLISRFRERLEFNANLNVAVDNFLLKILEVKYLCK